MSCDPGKLLEFIEDSGLSYKQNTVSYIFDCPKCGKRDKLYIRKRDGKFVCWFCKEIDGFRGRAEYALVELTSTPFQDIKDALYGTSTALDDDYFDLKLGDFFGEEDDVDEEAVLIPEMVWPHDYYPIDHDFARGGREYLAKRGISVEMAREYGLRFAPKRRRVVFPVEIGQRLVGWQERATFSTKVWSDEREEWVSSMKMLSSKGIPTAHTVMFSNRLRGSRHVVVCEGPIDAMKAHLCGGNVATMGKAVSLGQVKALREPASLLDRREVGQLANSGVERVYLALDPDAAQETTRLVREFSDLDVYLMHAPEPYEDLGDMPPEEVLALFHRAPRVSSANLMVFFDR